MGETKVEAETVTKIHTKQSKPFAHRGLSPFPLELLLSDIYVPQNRFLVLIECVRERVTPGIDHA